MMKVTGIETTLKYIKNESAATIARRKSEIMKTIVLRLREATPVDTGRARDGWSINANDIENNVEYIDRLNEGSSKQAPPYFIEKTVLSQPGVRPNGIVVKSK